MQKKYKPIHDKKKKSSETGNREELPQFHKEYVKRPSTYVEKLDAFLIRSG